MPETISNIQIRYCNGSNSRQYGERYVHFKDINQTDNSLVLWHKLKKKKKSANHIKAENIELLKQYSALQYFLG